MAGRNRALSEYTIIADLMRAAKRHGAALDVQLPVPRKDTFTVAATPATTYTLSALPISPSINFSLNGVELVEGVDYTVNYATAVVTVAATLKGTPTPPDVLTADYWTTGDLVAASAPADTGAVTDNFNRANSATTLNPASDGGTWSVDFGGVFGITSNTAYNVSAVVGVGPVTGPNVAIARRDVGQTAMEVIVDVTRSSTAGGSVIVACYDPVTTSCYEIFYDSSSSVGSLNRISGDGHSGAGVFLAFTAWTGGTTSLKLRADSAGVVTAYQLISGSWVSKGTFTDGFPLTGTWAGFGTAPTSPGADQWDNFSATAI